MPQKSQPTRALLLGSVVVLGASLLGLPSASAASSGCWDNVLTDVDGGGPDVIVGLPSYDLPGKPDAGAIVIYSNVAASGKSAPRAPQKKTLLTAKDFAGITPEAGARFGASVTVWVDHGTFDDADLCADVLVGAPGTTVAGKQGAGAVYLLKGSSKGLKQVSRTITEKSLGVAGGAQAGAEFGAVMAGLTRVALAVGAPGRDVGEAQDAGRVDLIPSFGESDEATPQVIEQGGLAGEQAEVGDRFGEVLELNASNGELIVGVPDEDVGDLQNAGMVTFIPPNGEASSIDQDSPNTAGKAEAGDKFGASLAAFSGNTAEDGLIGVIAVGVPGEDTKAGEDAGMIGWASYDVLDSSGTEWSYGPLVGLPEPTSQDAPGVPGAAEAGDRFGTSLLVIEPAKDLGMSYLVAGTPREDIDSTKDAGMVSMTPFDTHGVYVPRPEIPNTWTQKSKGAPGKVEAGDRFGARISAVTLTQPEEEQAIAMLLVTVPGEDLGDVPNAGLAQLGSIPGKNAVDLTPPDRQAGAGDGMVGMKVAWPLF